MHLTLPGKKIWLFKTPVDFRRAIDGLCSLVSSEPGHVPRDNIYIFYNRGKDKIKLLVWHRNGWVLVYKRLEKGRFIFNFNRTSGTYEIGTEEAGWLLAGLEWQKMRDFRELSYEKFS